jgi:hypothetical protein
LFPSVDTAASHVITVPLRIVQPVSAGSVPSLVSDVLSSTEETNKASRLPIVFVFTSWWMDQS